MPDLRLSADTLAVIVIDVQERLAAAMPEPDRSRCLRGVEILVESARLLSVPVLVTEQYPEGLGSTVASIRARLDAFDEPPPVVTKLDFDAMGDEGFEDALDHLVTQRGDGAIRTLIVCGMEAHVCVYQTVRSLAGAGFAVHVPYDATCSRHETDREIASRLWDRCGAITTTTESVVFGLLGSSRHPAFRTLSKLIR